MSQEGLVVPQTFIQDHAADGISSLFRLSRDLGARPLRAVARLECSVLSLSWSAKAVCQRDGVGRSRGEVLGIRQVEVSGDCVEQRGACSRRGQVRSAADGRLRQGEPVTLDSLPVVSDGQLCVHIGKENRM